ncbi:MAG: benzoyl-CoA reductase subunit D [Planctomycetes bacterium]|nr:benzoyl-CoA reductase subunit D [Planctomycetota bacterium]
MVLSAGLDVGSNAVKAVVIEDSGDSARVLGRGKLKVRGADVSDVVRGAFESALTSAGLAEGDLDYIATTGEGENVPFRTGHFYSMTCHSRGGLYLVDGATAALDIGALHGKVIRMDPRGKVLGYRMTSQCASGSGQFLENISRYLGITLEEIGPLSQRADKPEVVSSICAVLAETDVINMVSRGISASNILKGIHLSMAGRLLKLVRSAGVDGKIAMTGGLAADTGLVAAMTELASDQDFSIELVAHPDSLYAGAIGAGLWGAFRHKKLAMQAKGA